MATKAITRAPAPIFKKLSSVFLVSSALFAKAPPAKQTETLTQASGLPIVFVDDFSSLHNKAAIAAKLLKGQDCSMELEFNDIELTDEDRRVLELIKPILAKIDTIGPKYPWLPEEEPKSAIGFEGEYLTRGGYKITESLAKAVWAKASRYWAGLSSRAPSEHYEYIGNGNGHNYIRYGKDYVKIGCQEIPRSDVEYIARQKQWDPKLA